jgi:hypothetical protein
MEIISTLRTAARRITTVLKGAPRLISTAALRRARQSQGATASHLAAR